MVQLPNALRMPRDEKFLMQNNRSGGMWKLLIWIIRLVRGTRPA